MPAFASARAALRPPNPAPTITTRVVALLFIVPTYKIQRDGRSFPKFVGSAVRFRMDALPNAFGDRSDLCRSAGDAGDYTAGGALAGPCRAWMERPDRAADSRNARRSTRGFLFIDHARQALVCLGVALRPDCGSVGSDFRTYWGSVAHSGCDRRGILRDVSVNDCSRYECSRSGRARPDSVVGIDDSFSDASACVQLAVHSGVVLDPGSVGDPELRWKWSIGQAITIVDSVSVDAAVGQPAWRFPVGVCAARSLLGKCDVDVVHNLRQQHGRSVAQDIRREKSPGLGICGSVRRSRDFCQSLWMEAARPHLRLPLKSFLDGSHRRVPIAQLSWRFTEVFCRLGVRR